MNRLQKKGKIEFAKEEIKCFTMFVIVKKNISLVFRIDVPVS